jgi:hypothetical protein
MEESPSYDWLNESLEELISTIAITGIHELLKKEWQLFF